MKQEKKYNLDFIISKITLIITIAFVIALVLFVSASIYYFSPVDSNAEDYTSFVVDEGSSKSHVADTLANQGLIRNSLFFKIYMKINEKEIYAGTYRLSKNMSLDEIIDILNSTNSLENETITITFIEGKRLTSYLNQISETFDLDYDEIVKEINSKEFLDKMILKHTFLTNEILNEELKFALEGYLFPDTYILKKNSSLEEIIDTMLITMGDKLRIYDGDVSLSKYTAHQIITLASIIELEGANPSDRAGVAGVFYNRLDSGWTLGSDVTTYYAVDKNFDKDLYQSELDVCSPYNTRGKCAIPALPVGPIASPSLSALAATIDPEIHDYYYFVADKEKKTYFSKTDSEHNAIINKLKRENMWYEY